jgi:hypothetical protein
MVLWQGLSQAASHFSHGEKQAQVALLPLSAAADRI